MGRDTLFILRKDLKITLMGKETLLWVFVMPIIFFYFIGTVTGGVANRGSETETLALQTGENPGFLQEQLEHRLTERGYTLVEPETEAAFLEYRRRMWVPAAFTDSVLAGRPVKLRYAHDSSDFAGNYQDIRLGRAVYTLLADLLVSTELGQTPTAESLARLNKMPRALRLEVAPAGERQRIPSGYEQTIPGIMVMFVLLVMGTSGAILLVIERRQGLLRRLAYTPIARTSVVLGKWGGKFCVGVVQIAFAMLAGTIIFKMNWGPDLGWVVLVMLVYGALMAAVGMLLGNAATSEGMAAAIGVIAANVLAALGGCWWPIEVTPAWMQKLQLFLPTGWAMDALHKLISFGSGPTSVVPHLVGMALATAILVAVTVRVFRYEEGTEIAPLLHWKLPVRAASVKATAHPR